MTNAQVFAAFANRQVAKGGSVRTEPIGNVGVVLYSYATPIATNTSTHGVIFDVRRYSQTTSKQQTQARRAAGGVEMNHGDFRQHCRDMGVYLGGAR